MGAAKEADAFAQASFAIGFDEAVDDVGGRGEVDAASGADGFDAKGCGEMAFSGAALADEVDHLVAVDEIEAGKGHDAVAVERGLEGEVEARQGLNGGEP